MTITLGGLIWAFVACVAVVLSVPLVVCFCIGFALVWACLTGEWGPWK